MYIVYQANYTDLKINSYSVPYQIYFPVTEFKTLREAEDYICMNRGKNYFIVSERDYKNVK